MVADAGEKTTAASIVIPAAPTAVAGDGTPQAQPAPTTTLNSPNSIDQKLRDSESRPASIETGRQNDYVGINIAPSPGANHPSHKKVSMIDEPKIVFIFLCVLSRF